MYSQKALLNLALFFFILYFPKVKFHLFAVVICLIHYFWYTKITTLIKGYLKIEKSQHTSTAIAFFLFEKLVILK